MCPVVAQFRSGLPVFSMCAMRSCVFGVCASSMKCCALELEQPFLVDQRAALDLAAAQHGGDARRDLVVVLR